MLQILLDCVFMLAAVLPGGESVLYFMFQCAGWAGLVLALVVLWPAGGEKRGS